MNEGILQEMVARYIAMNYPKAQFHSDFGSGIKMTMGQAMKQRRQNAGRRGWPDMVIAVPSMGFHALFIELKKDGEKLHPSLRAKKRYKSIDGQEYKTEHLKEQADVLFKLRKAGYYADFAIGFSEAKTMIDSYMRGTKHGSGHDSDPF